MNKLLNLLKIQHPIIQAPMAGGITTPELVAAVSECGGLGSIGAGLLNATALRQTIQNTRKLTQKPFAVNVFIPNPYQVDVKAMQVWQKYLEPIRQKLNISSPAITQYAPNFDAQMQVILEENIPIVSFTFGILNSHWLNQLQQQGCVVIGTATTLEEARALEKSGIDAIVLQGSEAGGHRGSFLKPAQQSLVGLFDLVTQAVAEIDCPLIAAGGIMQGEQISALLKLGVSAAQLGTAFLVCEESGAHPLYKQAVLKAKETEVILTKHISGRYARGLKNDFIEYLQACSIEPLDYPVQNTLLQDIRQAALQQNQPDFFALWCGQGVAKARALKVADLISILTSSSSRKIRR